MSVINKLTGETAVSFSIDQTASVETVDGSDVTTAVTIPLTYQNSDGQTVNAVLVLHVTGENTTPLIASSPGKFRITVESI